ncbi:hypothetical protein ACHAXT_009204 [Thalassiosira profunda]
MSAPPSPADAYAAFQAGVTAALRAWSALREAVQQEWGGTESAAKAEDLRANIFVFFDGTSPKPKMAQEELEDNLLGYMEEEFGVVLEDGSEREVADLIYRMYEGCAAGDASLANSVVQSAIKAEEALKASNVKSVIQSGNDDMEDDSDDEGGERAAAPQQGEANGDATSSAAAAYASQTLFGGPPKPKKELPPPRQLGDAAPEKHQPELDDDGFAPVVTKKKGKKR